MMDQFLPLPEIRLQQDHDTRYNDELNSDSDDSDNSDHKFVDNTKNPACIE